MLTAFFLLLFLWLFFLLVSRFIQMIQMNGMIEKKNEGGAQHPLSGLQPFSHLLEKLLVVFEPAELIKATVISLITTLHPYYHPSYTIRYIFRERISLWLSLQSRVLLPKNIFSLPTLEGTFVAFVSVLRTFTIN